MSARQIILFAASAWILVTTPGCTTATAIPLEPCAKPVRRCFLSTVQLESIFSYSANQRELRSLIVAMGKEHGFDIQDHPGGTETPRGEKPAPYTISFVLREKSYLKGLKTIHSSAILAEISAPTGETLYQATWIRDGSKTLDSMSYLRKALHSVFRTLGRKAFHPQPW